MSKRSTPFHLMRNNTEFLGWESAFQAFQAGIVYH